MMKRSVRTFLQASMALLIGFAFAFSTAGVQVKRAAGTIVYVDASASGTGNGSSCADAYPSLADALAGAASVTEIWVAQGTYQPTSGSDRTATFQLKDGVAIYGGFAGGETQLDQRDWQTNVTTISGDLNGDDSGAVSLPSPTS